ncbi:UbiA-like polyprenyltransferase [Planctomycetota bacterium]
MKLFAQVRQLLEMIKFSHTVFALPFAILTAFLASGGLPPLDKLGWILLAMAGARSAAMSFNRITDRDIDAANPRTARRHLPAGKISLRTAWIFFLITCALFVFSAAMLNTLALALSPVALFVILFYSLSKRFSILCHAWLGLALGLGPVGAWIAIKAQFDVTPVMFGLVVMFWTAGFDIIYACQDYEFDVTAKIRSVPAVFGIAKGLWIARALHLITVLLLAAIIFIDGVGGPYFITSVLLVSLLLCYEHLIVKADDLKRLNEAFFRVNGVISSMLMLAVLADLFVGP